MKSEPSVEIVGISQQFPDGSGWKTEIKPLTLGLSFTSMKGKSLGLIMSAAIGDRFIYTKDKVN